MDRPACRAENRRVAAPDSWATVRQGRESVTLHSVRVLLKSAICCTMYCAGMPAMPAFSGPPGPSARWHTPHAITSGLRPWATMSGISGWSEGCQSSAKNRFRASVTVNGRLLRRAAQCREPHPIGAARDPIVGSEPDRLARPGLSSPPTGLRQRRTIADARCSPQWTGRGNRKSTRARRSPRSLPARRRKFGGIHPALQSQRHRARSRGSAHDGGAP